MLAKTEEKLNRKCRPTWVGYYTRVTPTRKEKIEKSFKKHKVDWSK